jgi:hypothetical protein|tara:strand:+ start:3540 stop:3845 length:306 start_codon:yes stop_codon:yes gene_type:complete
MTLPRTTPLQKEVLSGLSKGYRVHPTEYGFSDCENAISGNWLRMMNSPLSYRTVYALEEKGLIEIEYFYECGRCFPQVSITEDGERVALRYQKKLQKELVK